MTERKPPHLSFPDWVDHQIRTAESQGAFENLPGKGKPIDGLGTPRDEMAWIAEKMRRENVDIASALPPGLALAKEVEVLDDTLDRLHSETQVRDHVTDLNTRIRRALLAPQVGPPVRTRPVGVDEAVAGWHRRRQERRVEQQRIDSAPVPTRAEPERARRRMFFRRRRA